MLTARILAVRNAAPTRRLLDTSTSTVEVDASLTIDIPQNAQLSQNGAAAVVDDLLQVSGKWRPQRSDASKRGGRAGCMTEGMQSYVGLGAATCPSSNADAIWLTQFG